MYGLLVMYLLVLGVFAGATLAAEDCDPKVPEISSNAFDDWAGHGNWRPEDEPRDVHILVYFYTPWSDHCSIVSPIFERAASHLSNDSSVYLFKFNCGEWPQDCERQNVLQDPTLREWRGIPSSFNSYTSRAAIITMISELTDGAVSAIVPVQTSPWTLPSEMQTQKPSPKVSGNEIYVDESNTEAVVKLALPGAPFEVDESPEATAPSAIILDFKMSDNGHHLILNDYYHVALGSSNPSKPPEISAAQLGEQVKIDDLLAFRRLGAPLFLSPGRRISVDYEIDMNLRDDPSIQYYNHHPKLRLNFIGAGSGYFEKKTNFLLDNPSQKIVEVQMQEQNGVHSQHPNRNYTITGVKFLDRPKGYKNPDPRDATPCAFMSWRCADFSDPPFYRRIWRFQFDYDGRIGSLRRTCLRTWQTLRPVVLFVLCPAWGLLLVWKIGRALWRRRSVNLQKPLPLLPFEGMKGYR